MTKEREKFIANLYKTYSYEEIREMTGHSHSTIARVAKKYNLKKYKKHTKKTKKQVSPEEQFKRVYISKSIEKRITKIRDYIYKRYKKLSLTTKQAFDEIGFNRGQELGAVLNTDLLPTLSISDVARYIVLYR